MAHNSSVIKRMQKQTNSKIRYKSTLAKKVTRLPVATLDKKTLDGIIHSRSK